MLHSLILAAALAGAVAAIRDPPSLRDLQHQGQMGRVDVAGTMLNKLGSEASVFCTSFVGGFVPARTVTSTDYYPGETVTATATISLQRAGQDQSLLRLQEDALIRDTFNGATLEDEDDEFMAQVPSVTITKSVYATATQTYTALVRNGLGHTCTPTAAARRAVLDPNKAVDRAMAPHPRSVIAAACTKYVIKPPVLFVTETVTPPPATVTQTTTVYVDHVAKSARNKKDDEIEATVTFTQTRTVQTLTVQATQTVDSCAQVYQCAPAEAEQGVFRCALG